MLRRSDSWATRIFTVFLVMTMLFNGLTMNVFAENNEVDPSSGTTTVQRVSDPDSTTTYLSTFNTLEGIEGTSTRYA